MSSSPDLILGQAVADGLIIVEKKCVDRAVFNFPSAGDKMRVPLLSVDGANQFLLDMTRGRIRLAQATYQNRVFLAVVLLRLDLDGPPHTNPDGTEIGCPHLHRYREGYGDKWAEAVQSDVFGDPSDLWRTLYDFMRYCNVTQLPQLQQGLFP